MISSNSARVIFDLSTMQSWASRLLLKGVARREEIVSMAMYSMIKLN